MLASSQVLAGPRLVDDRPVRPLTLGRNIKRGRNSSNSALYVGVYVRYLTWAMCRTIRL